MIQFNGLLEGDFIYKPVIEIGSEWNGNEGEIIVRIEEVQVKAALHTNQGLVRISTDHEGVFDVLPELSHHNMKYFCNYNEAVRVLESSVHKKTHELRKGIVDAEYHVTAIASLLKTVKYE